MAKPQVTLTFAGDEKDLTRSFDNVGDSSRDMSDDLGKASKEIQGTGESFDRVSESADEVDTRAMGFRDTITGLQDTFKGLTDDSLSLGDRLFTLGAGVGDLASGVVNFVIPSIKNMTLGFVKQTIATTKNTIALGANKVATIASAGATKVLTVAQRGLNLAMRANPIGLVITALFALGAAFVLAWKKSETFRNIVKGAFNGIKAGFDVVVDAGKKFIDFMVAIVPKVGRAFLSVAKIITTPWRLAFQGIRNAWNNTIGGRGFSIPSWVPGIGGREFRIPRLHQGGRVPGLPGQESLAILQAGEVVIPASGARATEFVIRLDVPSDAMMARIIRQMFRKGEIRASAGNVRLVVT